MTKQTLGKMIGSTMADNLRQQYGRRSARVIKGDSVRVLRGEYKGVEGKVGKVNTEKGTLEIEGVQREKVRGGSVKVPIHASNVMIIGLNADDKYRQNKLQGTAKPESSTKKEGKENMNEDVKRSGTE